MISAVFRTIYEWLFGKGVVGLGRHRKIDRDALLDAAQDVLLREGAANLTIEAVAANAGISKASVLYDYKTKQALVRAMIERRFETEWERVRSITSELDSSADAGIQGWIKASRRELSDEDRMLAMGMIVALAGDPEFKQLNQRFFERMLATTIATATQPRGARLALLAVEGLKLLDFLGLHHWPQDECEEILRDIAWLAGQEPDTKETTNLSSSLSNESSSCVSR